MSDPDRHMPAREPLVGRCGHRGAGCSCCGGLRGTRDQKARERHRAQRAIRAVLAALPEPDDEPAEDLVGHRP